MTKDRNISIGRLLRRSTLQNHIKVDELPVANGEQRFELIKLRGSFTSFSSPDNVAADSVATGTTNKSGHDILVSLPFAKLLEMQPSPAGWFAVLSIDKAAKVAIESFVNAGRRHYKETNMHGGFVSPFSELRASDTQGGHVRVHVKIAECDGIILGTTLYDEKGEVMFKPGDQIASLHAKPLLGACSPTIHMAGYWYDQTKQGPLLYLRSVAALPASAATKEQLDEPPIISAECQTPKGSIRRKSYLSPIKNDTPGSNPVGLEDAFGELSFAPDRLCAPPELRAKQIMNDERQFKRCPSPPAPRLAENAALAQRVAYVCATP